MSGAHVTQKPLSYRPPARLPVHTWETVAALLPRLRCGTCRARLQVEPPVERRGRLYCPDCGRDYAELLEKLPPQIDRAAFASQERTTRRGRPPKTARPVDAPITPRRSQAHPCIDCGRLVGYRRVRCPECESAHRTTWTRLLDALADGQRYEASRLCDVLGITRDSLRNFVRKARASGYPIRGGRNSRCEGVYSLEVAS